MTIQKHEKKNSFVNNDYRDDKRRRFQDEKRIEYKKCTL